MNRILFIVISVVAFLSLSPVCAFSEPPTAKAGQMDLTAWDFQASPRLQLDGQWNFYWKQILPPSQPLPEAPSYMTVPSVWSANNLPDKPESHYGWATYNLNITLPQGNVSPMALKLPPIGTAYELYVNGQKLAASGTVGFDQATSRPYWSAKVVPLPAVQHLQIILHISDFHDLASGIQYPILLGTQDSLQQLRQDKQLFDIFLFGCLFIMGLYHLGLFIFRTKDKAPLYFALLCILVSWRGAIYDELLILQLFPSMSWKFLVQLGYWDYALATWAFFNFMQNLFPVDRWKPANYIVTIGTALYCVLITITPIAFFSSFLNVFHIVTALTGIYTLTVLIRAIKRREAGAVLFLIAFLVLFLTTSNDILRTMIGLQTMILSPFGLLIFLLFQSLVMTKKFSSALTTAENTANHLNMLNASFERFVPKEVLAFLKKNTIAEIQLGDHAESHMTVMFIDIRNFTGLSEKMSPQDNFKFINSYLKKVGPVIRASGGFVDKYIGDGIMALFPDGAESAVQAALNILDTVQEFNVERLKTHPQPIRVAIGVHSGALMLGTIGENLRMDSTVISDTVNVASRMEGLAKQYDKSLLVTETTYNQLQAPELYLADFLGEESVKGKSEKIGVWTINGRVSKVNS